MSGDPRSYNKQQRIKAIADLMRTATLVGRKVTLKELQTAFAISKPTAIEDKRAAEALLMAEGTGVSIAPKPGRGKPAKSEPREPREPKDTEPKAVVARPTMASPADASGDVGAGVMLGTTMLLELSHSAQSLKTLAEDLVFDIRHARYFVLGTPAEHEYPGLCRHCGAEEIAKLTVRRQPLGLQVGYSDLASLAGQAAKAHTSIAKVIQTYNDILAQFYHYGAMQKYIMDVRQAIINVVPERQREIAAEIRRLQTLSGGAHGGS